MASLRELLSAPRYEVIPAKGTEQAVAGWVPAGMTVAVTASPVKGLEPTVELAEKLAARGYRVVPHLAARSVASQAHLDEIVARLTACGVDDVFVPGGDATHPAGPFDGALPLLERLDAMGRPFGRIGITGYPESHPKIHDDITIQAMWDKRRYASYIVSNVTFDAAGLGLDRYPELWDDYFGHYTRLVWLAQEPSAALAAEADRVAGRFGLPLTRVDVGVSRLEQALAGLVGAALWPACASCCPRRGTR